MLTSTKKSDSPPSAAAPPQADMPEHWAREKFIPIRAADLIQRLAADVTLTPADRDLFQQLCRLLTATFHYEYHDSLKELKNLYARFDPDADTLLPESLSRSLYYQNLDNNAGVLFRLLDEAEEQECREAILAYFFLWHTAKEGWSSARLDVEIEAFLAVATGASVDFEVTDALAKLKRLGLVEGDDLLRAVPIEAALERLDRTWDCLFSYCRDLQSEATPGVSQPNRVFQPNRVNRPHVAWPPPTAAHLTAQ